MFLFSIFQGLTEACSGTSLEEDTNIRMISLFDNEEVRSFLHTLT